MAIRLRAIQEQSSTSRLGRAESGSASQTTSPGAEAGKRGRSCRWKVTSGPGEHSVELTALDELDEIVGAADERSLDEDHRKRRPAGPHLERVASPPHAEVRAVLEVLVPDIL